MIVVVGLPVLERSEPPRAGGLATAIARGAAAAGATVQLMGKVGDDPEGDLVLLDLAAAGIGHPAILRDPVRRTPGGSRRSGLAENPAPTLEPADLELGLRYVPDFRVIVLAAPDLPTLLRPAADAAGYAAAHLIMIAKAQTPAVGLPERSTVLTIPRGSPDGGSALPALVAAYAVALDAGEDSETAWGRATARAGVGSRP